MKDSESPTKIETRLGQVFRPFPVFLTGAIAGSVVTVYGTLTQVNLFNYVGSNHGGMIRFYGDLLGLSKKFRPDQNQFDSRLKLGIGADETTLEIYTLPNSVCDSAILPGDQIPVPAQAVGALPVTTIQGNLPIPKSTPSTPPQTPVSPAKPQTKSPTTSPTSSPTKSPAQPQAASPTSSATAAPVKPPMPSQTAASPTKPQTQSLTPSPTPSSTQSPAKPQAASPTPSPAKPQTLVSPAQTPTKPPPEVLQDQIEKITTEGVGTLDVKGIQGPAKLDINLLTETQTCIRKSQAVQELEQLLKSRQWQAADQKTYEIILAVSNRKAVGFLDANSISNLSCTDLKTLDQLWKEESGGLWSFGIQKQLYEKAGNQLTQTEPQLYNLDGYVHFVDLVRWIESGANGKESWKPYKQLSFSLDASEGHLPRLEQLATGLKKTQPGYQLLSAKGLPLDSQEIQARSLFFHRVAACEL